MVNLLQKPARSQGTGNGQFDSASGIEADSSGNVYVVDSNNHDVQKFDSNGTILLQSGVQMGPTTDNLVVHKALP